MSENLQRIGLLYQPYIAASRELAEQLAEELQANGVTTWVCSSHDTEAVEAQIDSCDLLITFGGDGTILRAARAAIPEAPPILAVNFGQLGFLAEVKPAEAPKMVPRVLAGDYWIEERPLLDVTIVQDGEPLARHVAVNDAVLARGDGPHALDLDVWIDGAHVTEYVADGVIVASPTGSTAYALAAGGPVVAPTVDAILVVPIAAHLAFLRNLIVPADSVVEVSASSRYQQSVAVIDGQVDVAWHHENRMRVTQSRRTLRFARFGSRQYFYSTLVERLSRHGRKDD